MFVALWAAVAAGACFAVAGVLQQQAASARPEEEAMSFRLLGRLARRPLWLGGILLAVLAYGFQSLALAFGPLSLVQPLIVSELVFAIPLAARLHRMRLRAREWLGTLAVAGGLVLALVAAHPRAGDPRAGDGAWLPAMSAVCAATVVALAAGRFASGAAKASLTALAAGIVMGTQSVLLAATVARIPDGWAGVFGSWQTWLLVAASVLGLLLIQSAFQEGPLAASMPVMDFTEPAVAVVLGVLVFGEEVGGGLLSGVAAAVGVLVLLAGVVVLDTSPLLAALHRREQQEPLGWPGQT